MPLINSAHLAWNCMGDAKTNQVCFDCIISNRQSTEIPEFILCNTFFEIEQPVFTYAPNVLPIGPLLPGHRFGKPVGHFWKEDTTCMAWLDEQPENSVVYVAFGSYTVFNRRQFQELALGLEQTGRRFLWVAREDITAGTNDAFPDGFKEQTTGRGRVVGWSPQPRVLAHPAVACFVTHCGWNSTMEGVRHGVPFLCWPYFVDQFLDQDYICDIWRIGLKMTPDESGIVSKEQFKSKVDKLLENDEIKERSLALKEMANKSVQRGGSSFKNFDKIVDAMKA